MKIKLLREPLQLPLLPWELPLPLQEQEAFKGISRAAGSLDVSSELSSSVLSLPVYPEITHEIQDRVIDAVCGFFRKGC